MVAGRRGYVTAFTRWPATLVDVSTVDTASSRKVQSEEKQAADAVSRSMAVSIAGVSTACSKDALASSAKAVRESLSTE
jgi:hypothetical protein